MAEGDPALGSGAQPRHFLRACVLLLLGEEPAHGYELLERLAEFGLGEDSGTVYRLLRALEHQGRLTSSWQRSDQGPARRCYELCGPGFAELDAWVAALARSREELTAFVARAAARPQEGAAGNPARAGGLPSGGIAPPMANRLS
ncbi:MAG: PadR family transcriptional regulator [Candidatus Dormibacteria bacterium]